MNLLAIDTSTSLGSVAVTREGVIVAEVTLGIATRHAETLLPAIDFALRAGDMRKELLDSIVVGAGPGSFTGVRIAAATAKALVHVLGIPLRAHSSLQAAAVAAGQQDRAVCVLFDARRAEAFAGCWQLRDFACAETLLAPIADTVDAIVARIQPHDPLYIGDGATRNRARIEAAGGTVAPEHIGAARARGLVQLTLAQPETGVVAEPARWEPDYVRAPNVTIPA